LFNLRHASARNVIERIFGVLKQRFRILLLAPQYSLEIQARIPAALAAIHNFICEHSDADDDNHLEMNGGDTFTGNASHDNFNDSEDDGLIFNDENVDERRDQIAQAMWDDYQKVCKDRKLERARRNVGTDNGTTDSDSDDDDELDDVF
jgi:DDE superfamily endonuclease